MYLSELTAYAGEKYNIQEQHKWADFPGFSVLASPDTGKWLALLMRQWDTESGEMLERCDIKCGQSCKSEIRVSYVTAPFRMKGQKWAGVIIDRQTEPETVFRLFDCAVTLEKENAAGLQADSGYTVVLEETCEKSGAPQNGVIFKDIALPFYRGTRKPPSIRHTARTEPSTVSFGQVDLKDLHIPEQILKMRALYDFGDGSFLQKQKNFYRQGKFMESYEDDRPWMGEFRRYFPTYHDLNIPQLRGYFTWRTHVRKGEFRPAPDSFAYIYLYELLCGIGSAGPLDSLQKMREFEREFPDTGSGDSGIRKDLRRWMQEYAILKRLPAEVIAEYADPDFLKRDSALISLKNPDEHTDDEVFAALVELADGKLAQSPVIEKHKNGKHLFASLWRYMTKYCVAGDKDLFASCFGQPRPFVWHPLGSAVFWTQEEAGDADITVNPLRSYRCRGGEWKEVRYDPLYFNKERLQSIVHEADRALRSVLKTGHYLRRKAEEAWITPYVDEVLEEERRAEEEAARPVITIDLSGLEQIRTDAGITRDSLLTEEETEDALRKPEPPVVPETPVIPEQPYIPETPNIQELPEGLDELHVLILTKILLKEDADALIRENRLMPSVVTDTINEALFDLIGDAALMCEGSRITVTEDYEEDLKELLFIQTEAQRSAKS